MVRGGDTRFCNTEIRRCLVVHSSNLKFCRFTTHKHTRYQRGHSLLPTILIPDKMPKSPAPIKTEPGTENADADMQAQAPNAKKTRRRRRVGAVAKRKVRVMSQNPMDPQMKEAQARRFVSFALGELQARGYPVNPDDVRVTRGFLHMLQDKMQAFCLDLLRRAQIVSQNRGTQTVTGADIDTAHMLRYQATVPSAV